VEAAATKIQAVFRGHKVRAGKSEVPTKSPVKPPTKAELEAEFNPDDKGKQSSVWNIWGEFEIDPFRHF
jgi:IQ calmodulin-binding motif